jgi:hypothetical protein
MLFINQTNPFTIHFNPTYPKNIITYDTQISMINPAILNMRIMFRKGVYKIAWLCYPVEQDV